MGQVAKYHWFRFVLLLALATASAPLLAADKPTCVWVMNADGSNAHRLIRLDGYDYHRMPRWSRTGKQFAFYAANKIGFAHEVFIANADGSDPRQLAIGDCPDWSADGKQLLFDKWNSPGFIVEVLNSDGTGHERLGTGSAPRWSPDGAQMAIIRGATPIVVELSSDQEWTLFDAPLARLGESLAWSPDGKFLALFAEPNQNDPRQLLIISAKGATTSKRVRLKHVTGSVVNYSPDGKQLVFDAADSIQIIDVEGSGLPRVLPGQVGHNRDAHFSPDGKQIIFVSNRDD